ncbi:hypothetical protein FB45DRAFT_400940 [Roridomyces roridus]|uniref:Uncharacterized protein n=1 Tax=Roridomyces roridus TaxID=1738132 RepID=A0AAD7C3Q8_9AGAR|nr:hypothetical protein FB45DRAFT_400940 [Roridomyces roridus]
MAHLRTLCLVLGIASVAQSVVGLPNLLPRQDNTIPAQCESTCQPVETLVPTCPSAPSQCCTQLFQSGYASCLTCVGLADNVNAAGFAVAQATLDNFTIECSELGFTLPKLTLPGQNSARPLSTVSGSHSVASASNSQITISNLPLSLSAPTISQTTITQLSSSSPSATAPPASSASASAPANNNNNAAQRIGHNWTLVLLAACTLLYVG